MFCVPEEGAGAGAVARRGLPRGAVSRAFSVDELVRCAREARRRPAPAYVQLDGAGRVAGGAALCARARLAPHHAARDAQLECAGGGALRVRLLRARAPHDELALWPSDALCARVGLPALTPRHITPEGLYGCPACAARFEHPNPLKLHLYLSCAAPAPAGSLALWRRMRRALAAADADAKPDSAARPDSPAPALPAWTAVYAAHAAHATHAPLAGPAPLSPAALEALATAWGRQQGAAGAGAGAAGHRCVYCGKLYSRRYGLKIHLRTHTGYKPLRCRHCARAFGDPSNLNKHVRLHAAHAAHAPHGPARRRDLAAHE